MDAYGFDVRSWSGFPVLREVCELFMTVSLAQDIDKSPAVASEVAMRLVSLRDCDSDRAWTWTAGPPGQPDKPSLITHLTLCVTKVATHASERHTPPP